MPPSINAARAQTFVCYARHDAPFVASLVADLRERGVALWIDTNITPGADWDRSIDEALRTCANVLVILSPAAVASNEVRGELRAALNLRKPVVPLLYEPCEVPRQLQNTQYLDFTADRVAPALRERLAQLLVQVALDNQAPDDHPDVTRSLRNRRDLLADVREEIDGRLRQSVAVPLAIPFNSQPDLVTRAWDSDVRLGSATDADHRPVDNLVEAFDSPAVAGRLLILGAPGAGKTTSLLLLGRELIARAERDQAEPMPVFFNLLSWRSNQPIADWLLDQLRSKYGVRRNTARLWLDSRALLPLLDGLDEVPSGELALCVDAINLFLHECRPRSAVVCSRAAEYENARGRLQLNGAIRLLPLADDQIETYLVGTRRPALWETVRSHEALRQCARSPLLLRFMATASSDTPDGARHGQSAVAQQEVRLFDEYLARAVPQDDASVSYSRFRTLTWLTWLADALRTHGQAELLLEQMQPSWLNTAAQRWCYRACALVAGASVFAAAQWAVLRLFAPVPEGPLGASYGQMIDATGIRGAANVALSALMALAVGAAIGAKGRIQPIETLSWSTTKAWRGASEMVSRWSGTALRIAISAGLAAGLIWGLALVPELSRSETSSLPLRRWGVMGYVASAVPLAILLCAIALTKPRSASAEGSPVQRAASSGAVAAMFAGLAIPNMGLLGLSAAIALGLLTALHSFKRVVAPERLIAALTAAAVGAAVAGSVSFFVVGPTAGPFTWIGVWLFASAGPALTLALVSGLRSFGVTESHTPGAVSWKRRAGALAAVAIAAGVLVAVLTLIGGPTLVRQCLLFGARTSAGLVQGLNLALLIAALALVFAGLMGPFVGTVVGALKGLTGPDVQRRAVPNQGLRQSARNIPIFALLGLVLVGAPYGIVNVLIGTVISGAAPGAWDWLNLGLGGAMLFALLGAFIPAAACIQHASLRVVLWCWGLAPLRYVRFLNYATERQLLERIGGRYRFIHDQLRDYLASARGENRRVSSRRPVAG